MQRLKSVFADKHGLHSRIDTYLRHSSVLRVGIIPVLGSHRSSKLLDALVDDPIEQTQWSRALANRPLTKDILVTQSSNFEFTETQNSLVSFPVPFPGDAIEYLEVNSLKDSWDHLKHCHLHLFVTDRLPANAPLSHFPSLTICDSGSPLGAPTSDLTAQNCQYRGELLQINSESALRANAALQESPSNASMYTKLWNESGITELRSLLKDPKIHEALKNSIISSCQEQISEIEAKVDSQSLKDVSRSRTSWSQDAHRELQGSLLPKVRDTLYHDLAFYKLYARTDDVEPALAQVLDQALSRSQNQMQYLKGRLGSSYEADAASNSTLKNALEPATLTLQNSALRTVLTSLFGIQIPLVALSIVGAFFGGFSWYSMGALASLGVVSGLKKIQNDWLKGASKYEDQVQVAALAYIEEAQRKLWDIKEEGHFQANEMRLRKESALNEAIQEL